LLLKISCWRTSSRLKCVFRTAAILFNWLFPCGLPLGLLNGDATF
jgi:hypothetical protein